MKVHVPTCIANTWFGTKVLGRVLPDNAFRVGTGPLRTGRGRTAAMPNQAPVVGWKMEKSSRRDVYGMSVDQAKQELIDVIESSDSSAEGQRISSDDPFEQRMSAVRNAAAQQ